MGKYILKRLGLCIVTIFVILSLTFILIKLLPIQIVPGTAPQQASYCEEQVHLGYFYRSEIEVEGANFLLKYYEASVGKTYYYYQTPILRQYANWLKNIFTKWDWGRSTKILPNNTVLSIIRMRLPVTVKINIWSVLLSVPLGILLGIIAALKKNTAVDHTISTLIMVAVSIPSFVLITLLIYVFGYKAGVLPTKWPASSAGVTFAMRFKAYIIPVLCLSFGSICGYARVTRAELCEVMESDYLLLARTKGLTRKQAIIRHALKNSMVPIFPSILSEVIGLLFGSMILESLYGIPGIGGLFIDAINGQDYNVLFVDMALTTTISLVADVFLDISYSLIDPRIRMGAKK